MVGIVVYVWVCDVADADSSGDWRGMRINNCVHRDVCYVPFDVVHGMSCIIWC